MNDATGMPQTVVVLGGGSDIARSLLRLLAARRMERLLLVGRSAAGLEAARAELTSLGVGLVETVELDLRHSEALAGLATQAFQMLGSIDLLLVAAGSLEPSAGWEPDPVTLAGLLEDTFVGPAAAMAAFAPLMRRQGHGRIVVLSSVAGWRVRQSNFSYGSAKAGLDGFAQGLGDALSESGVEVTIVRPGFVRTKMTAGRPDAPFAIDATKAAEEIFRGLERGAPTVWVPSFLRYVFGAFRFLPRSLWRRIPG